LRSEIVAALKVHRHVEVAPAQQRMVGGSLDRLLPDVEPDLPPLVHQPDADRLVRLGDAAVSQCEREALGQAGLLQQPTGLGAAGADVAPVAGELLQLGRRRGPGSAGHLDAADLLDHGDA